MAMERREYRVTFLTPAFLGGADQSARWRTPPFKALLRQWWRIAYAADHGFKVDLAKMRHDEGVLFGHAWLKDDRNDRGQQVAARRSLVRMRLDRWDIGRQRGWDPLPTVTQPEVKTAVGADLYLGYGPITLPRGAKKPELKGNAAIQAGEAAGLALALPEEHAGRIARAVWLMDRYGALGGRSRNGWGSCRFFLEGGDEEVPSPGDVPLRPWRDCLDLDWPHAIGEDEKGPLIWQTEPRTNWASVMRDLAIVKIGLRTQFVFPNSPLPHLAPLERHWLSYPITRHTTRAWKNGFRLPNTLRFKVRTDGEGRLRGVVFHVPCAPPAQFRPDRRAIETVWQRVHRLLDECTVAGPRPYAVIADVTRRSQLKSQLDEITLQRIRE